MRNTYLVCHDRRLAKVHKTMRGCGDRLQCSIFECQFTRTDLARCRHLLSEIIDHREDRVLFVYFTFVRKYSIVLISPSSSWTLGSQCSSVRARVMSGRRCRGSSVGRGL